MRDLSPRLLRTVASIPPRRAICLFLLRHYTLLGRASPTRFTPIVANRHPNLHLFNRDEAKRAGVTSRTLCFLLGWLNRALPALPRSRPRPAGLLLTHAIISLPVFRAGGLGTSSICKGQEDGKVTRQGRGHPGGQSVEAVRRI